MISNQKKMIFAGVGLAVILGLAGVGLYFTSRTASKPTAQLDTRSRASTNNPEVGVAKISLKTSATTPEAPMISTRYVGDTFPVEIWMNTGGKTISSLSIRLKYTPDSTTSPNLEIVDQDTNTPGIQITSMAKADNPQLDMNTILNNSYKEGSNFVIDLSAISTSPDGYKTPTTASAAGTLLGVIKLKVNKATTTGIMFNADSANSRIHDKATAQDILFDITPPLQINLLTDNQAPQITSWKITDHLGNDFSTSGYISTGSAAKISWSVTDLPPRPNDTTPNLTVMYRLGSGAWTTVTDSNIKTGNMSLANATNTITFCVKDHLGNTTPCSGTTSTKTATTNLAPKLLSFNPKTGPATTLVTLDGYNFGNTSVTNGVLVCTKSSTNNCASNAAATIVSWNDNKIVIKQPSVSGQYRIKNSAGLTSDSIDLNPYNFIVETKLAFAFNFQGISIDRGDIPVTITIGNGTKKIDTLETIAKWSTTDNAYQVNTAPIKYTTPSNPPNPATESQYSYLPAGKYNITVKSNNHLRKKFANINFSPGIVNSVVKKDAVDQIPVGDINNDNKISLEDFSLLMTKYVSLSVAVTNTSDELSKNCDLNKDGVINTQDISLLLSNYKALNNPGDIDM